VAEANTPDPSACYQPYQATQASWKRRGSARWTRSIYFRKGQPASWRAAWPHRDDHDPGAHPLQDRIGIGQARAWPPQIDLAEHRVRRKQVLGGLTHEYQIAAW